MVDVAVDIPSDKTFTYAFHPGKGFAADIGARVVVPFRGRLRQGIVVGINSGGAVPPPFSTLPVKDILDNTPYFGPLDIEYARRCARLSWVGLGEMLSAMLPQPLRRRTKGFACCFSRPSEPKPGEVVELAASIGEFKVKAFELMASAKGPAILIVETKERARRYIQEFSARYGITPVYFAQQVSNDELSAALSSSIMIGTRHAVFFPIRHCETIIIENSWLKTYRQEVTPKYDTIELAKARAKINGGKVYLHRPPTANKHKVVAVDATAHKGLLPPFLREQMSASVSAGKCWAVFSFAKGMYRRIECSHCGGSIMCENCKRPMILAREGRRDTLVCPGCDKKILWDNRCPACGSIGLKFARWGRQRIVRYLRERLFGTPVYEHITGAGTGENGAGVYLIEHWVNMDAEFDNVCLLDIDAILNLNYPYAKKYAIDFVSMAASKARGKIYVITTLPEIFADPAASLAKDEETRRRIGLPPYGMMVRLEVRGIKEPEVLKRANHIAKQIRSVSKEVKVIGPYAEPNPIKRRQYFFYIDLLLDEDSLIDKIRGIILSKRKDDKNILVAEPIYI